MLISFTDKNFIRVAYNNFLVNEKYKSKSVQ